MWRTLLLCSCLLAATARAAPAPDQASDEGCVVVDGVFLNHRMSVNETFNTGPDPCNTYTCAAHGQWTALTCPYFPVAEGCELVPGSTTAAYPECCPQVHCNENLLGVDDPHGKEPLY